jgi:HlyD family secretion protein
MATSGKIGWIAAAAVVVGVAAAAAAFWPGAAGPTDQYRFAPVERGRLLQQVSATGTVAAETLVQVGSQTSGRIVEMLADFNTPVTRGMVVARLDPALPEARLAEADAEVAIARAAVLTQEAQVVRARADLENARLATGVGRADIERARANAEEAERDFGRRQDLVARGVAPASERDRTMAQRDVTRAQLQAARAQETVQQATVRGGEAQLRIAEANLENAKAIVAQREAVARRARIDLEYTIIRSPVDGVVISRNVDVGQTVAASLQAPVLFTIARDLRRLQLETAVDEADVGRVKLGQFAGFTVDAFPGERFRGRVTQIRKAASTVNNVVTYVVVIAVDNADQRLIPGMTASVRVLVDEKQDVVKVPNAAFRWRPPGAPPAQRQTRVWRLGPNGEPEAVTLKPGIGDGAFTEQADGPLQAGDRLIVGMRAAPRAPSGPRFGL